MGPTFTPYTLMIDCAEYADACYQQYLWGVDLYSSDLSSEAESALVANQDMLQQVNSEGYNAQVIIQHFKSLPAEECEAVTKPKQMSEWLNNVFGVGIDHCVHLLTILNHNEFHHLFLEYCLTYYRE